MRGLRLQERVQREGPGECPVCGQTGEEDPPPHKPVGKVATVPPAMLLPKYQWLQGREEVSGEEKEAGGAARAGEGGAGKGIWSRLRRYGRKWLLVTLPRDEKGGGANLALIETKRETREEKWRRERKAVRELQVLPPQPYTANPTL